MFSMRNGVLHMNGSPVFGLGVSYYPSYHPQKVPVPPDGDRTGELEKDINGMRLAGFNIVRMAALGEVERSGGQVRADFPFIDQIIGRAAEKGIASMVRLQGYGVNLSGFTDHLMLNQNDEEMPFHWGWFVRNCINHEGILSDNIEATRASAGHFDRFPSVVSYQIYNEPAYPACEYYDYNPHSIQSWRRWMAERGYASESEACELEPPRRRPVSEGERELWIQWRSFHYERMNDFLNQLSDVAKESSPSPETLTCHMAWPACAGATVRGEDYFRVAEKMDIVGITHYITALGASHFVASEVLDMAESAAACFGKHAWLIEYNARTDMAANEWERETYSAVGSGYKGIIYYQWRADYPYADGPEPEGFGMIFNDGRKTPKFERAAAMNSLVAGLGPDFVRAEKLRSGVGVLYSENVNAYYDALDNGDERDVAFYHERSAQYMKAIYADFRRARVSVDFIRAKELKENRIGVELLLVPSTEGLTEDERRKIEDFASGEGRVFLYHPDTLGYVPFKDENPVPFYVSMGGRGSVPMDAESVLEHCGIEPMCSCRTQTLDVKVLEAEQRYLVCLVNFDPQERPLESGTALSLRLPGAKAVQSAKMYTPEAEHELEFVKEDNGSLSLMLPALGMGAFIVLEKGASEK